MSSIVTSIIIIDSEFTVLLLKPKICVVKICTFGCKTEVKWQSKDYKIYQNTKQMLECPLLGWVDSQVAIRESIHWLWLMLLNVII